MQPELVYIKYFFMLLSCFYIFPKLLNIPFSKKRIGLSILVSCVFPVPFYYVRVYVPALSLFFMVFIFLIVALHLYHITLNTALITSVITFGLSYFLFMASAVVMSPFILALEVIIENDTIYHTTSQIAASICQFILSILPFRIRRLKNGMTFLYQQDSNDTGAFISALLLMAASLSSIRKENDLIFALPIFFIAICGLLLFFWWKKQLTQKYKNTLREKEFEYLSEEIESLQSELQKLKNDNEEMSKIIHKDNKLIPAMELAVREMLALHQDASNTQGNTAQLSELTALSEQLELLSKDRKGILHVYESSAANFASTGLARFDALLRYMKQKASEYDASFRFSLNANIQYLVKHITNEDDLCTLVADFTENAFIASKGQQTRNVLVNIGIENNNYCLNVFDSGIPFEQATLSRLGKGRITTHADSGGSGIGMMTAFEIAHKYNASICIDESIHNEMYTKKVSVCFDGLNEFRVE